METGAQVRVRVIVDGLPANTRFAIQRGKSDLLVPTQVRPDCLQFDFSLRLGAPKPDGMPNYLGEYAQGTPADRFVYINSGTLAGQGESCWSRRAKLKLGPIPSAIWQAAIGQVSCIMQARVLGIMADGGPVCASVKPQAVTWSLISVKADGSTEHS